MTTAQVGITFTATAKVTPAAPPPPPDDDEQEGTDG